jgi:hypothetical protein
MDDNKTNYNRENLRNLFKNGLIPSEKDYALLIESTINKLDDGFSKNEVDGLKITKAANSEKLISFYTEIDEDDAAFSIQLNQTPKPGIAITAFNNQKEYTDIENKLPQPSYDPLQYNSKSFCFDADGNVGIGRLSNDNYKLDVNGFAGFGGRIGNITSKIPADGKWHPIITNLNNCQAFEIIASTGKKEKGRFAILHAIALSAFGGKKAKGKINKTSSYYGFCWNKISLKWTGSAKNYALQMRTGRNYGDNVFIIYYITELWNNRFYPDPSYYY